MSRILNYFFKNRKLYGVLLLYIRTQLANNGLWTMVVCRFTYEFSWAYISTIPSSTDCILRFRHNISAFLLLMFLFFCRLEHIDEILRSTHLSGYLYIRTVWICPSCYHTLLVYAASSVHALQLFWLMIFPTYLSTTEVDSFTWRTCSYWWYWCWRLASSIRCSSWPMYILLFIIHR